MQYYVWDHYNILRPDKTDYAEFETSKGYLLSDDFPRCPFCHAQLGGRDWLPPFSGMFTAAKLGDLCGDILGILLSERFRAKWESSGLQGLEFLDDEIKAVYKRNVDTKRYFVTRVQHTLTLVDHEASGLVPKKIVGCEKCGVMSRKKLERLRFVEKTISELDVFRPSGLYGRTIVTERFVGFVNEHKYTNFYFVHQDDCVEPRSRDSQRGQEPFIVK